MKSYEWRRRKKLNVTFYIMNIHKTNIKCTVEKKASQKKLKEIETIKKEKNKKNKW